MVKIKDFTLASQNLGGHLTPRALHTGRPWRSLRSAAGAS